MTCLTVDFAIVEKKTEPAAKKEQTSKEKESKKESKQETKGFVLILITA